MCVRERLPAAGGCGVERVVNAAGLLGLLFFCDDGLDSACDDDVQRTVSMAECDLQDLVGGWVGGGGYTAGAMNF